MVQNGAGGGMAERKVSSDYSTAEPAEGFLTRLRAENVTVPVRGRNGKKTVRVYLCRYALFCNNRGFDFGGKNIIFVSYEFLGRYD